MDFNDYWQENKRFVMTVAAGLLVFLFGQLLVSSFFGKDLQSKREEIGRTRRDLAKGRFGSQELAQARSENEALKRVSDALLAAAAFRPRPAFVLDPAAGTPTNQYFARVEEVRDRLHRAAGRANVRIQNDLGLPALAPTREDEVVRYLEALDLLERVSQIAIEERVPRVERIEIRLDPSLHSTRPGGEIEKTRIKLRMIGPSAPLARLLVATQDPARGPSLLIDSLEMLPERTKTEESILDVVFAIARPRRPVALPGEA
jgi:hypothetical protein